MSFHFSPKIVTDGLILYLDAANGKSYIGSGTSSSNLVFPETGSLDNEVLFSSQNNGYFSFDGTDSVINFGNRISSLNLSYPFTIDVWLRANATLNTTTFRGIFSSSTTPTLTQYYGVSVQLGSAYNGSGNYKIGAGVGNGVSPGSTGRYSFTTNNEVVIGNTWCNVIATFDSPSVNIAPIIKIYVNGSNCDGTYSGTGGSLVWGSSTTTNIGQPPGGYQYILNGDISIVRFYNKLLTSDQVIQNYNATKSRYI
jgi:hypothetical protein